VRDNRHAGIAVLDDKARLHVALLAARSRR